MASAATEETRILSSGPKHILFNLDNENLKKEGMQCKHLFASKCWCLSIKVTSSVKDVESGLLNLA